jgi:hypothetical protein
MKTNQKRQAALRLLAATGIWPSSYAPPLIRLLWRFGLDLPPPHFGSFWSNAAFMGTFFAIVWGAFMWLVLWSGQDLPWPFALAVAGAEGIMFGFAMASYYAYGKPKHNLPSWKELKSHQ